jgi:hypothetical protein
LHYTAASVTTPIPDSASKGVKAPGKAHPSLSSLADRVDQLSRRATLLNDQAEVTNLQDTYGYAVDRKLWDQAADLFAWDGTLELGCEAYTLARSASGTPLINSDREGSAAESGTITAESGTITSICRQSCPSHRMGAPRRRVGSS